MSEYKDGSVWPLMLAWGLVAALFIFILGVRAGASDFDYLPKRCYPNWTCDSGQECVELPRQTAGQFVGFCVDPASVTVGPKWERLR